MLGFPASIVADSGFLCPGHTVSLPAMWHVCSSKGIRAECFECSTSGYIEGGDFATQGRRRNSYPTYAHIRIGARAQNVIIGVAARCPVPGLQTLALSINDDEVLLPYPGRRWGL